MNGIYWISPNDGDYGRDARDGDGQVCANYFAEKLRENFPDIYFRVGDGQTDIDYNIALEVDKFIDDHFEEWLSEVTFDD